MDAVAAIYRHHVLHGTATFETEPRTAEDMRQRRAAIAKRGLPYLVTEGKVGVLGGGRWRDGGSGIAPVPRSGKPIGCQGILSQPPAVSACVESFPGSGHSASGQTRLGR
ncbi:hypothetical protein BKE38_00235 [Pseudoroseomonas deserti]|uniref:Uncharacterized protein n=1 Tax=Teichococcus deserti TaxID=1817963 RepID=A0A1V2HAP5_9PROT|nr:hypothetical protein BKE38_00235 [Pseudoroseomonas deserti]